MKDEPISNNIQRFINTSIDSIPQLEALLLIQKNPEVIWDFESLSRALFIQPKLAIEFLRKLCSAGFLRVLPNTNPRSYEYVHPNLEVRQMLSELAEVYSKHLILITNMVHNICNLYVVFLGTKKILMNKF